MSPAGLVGAVVGALIGAIDYAVLARIIRRALDKAGGPAAARGGERRVALLMRVVFVINILAFAAIGYWFGVTFGG